MTRQELITKATEDPEFREQLKADPRGTVAQEFGSQIPDDVEITVLEETPKHAYIVLPPQASELSPEDLEGVAGGEGQAQPVTPYDPIPMPAPPVRPDGV